MPEVTQFMMNLICVGDGDIPVLMEMASGNQSDQTRFAQLFQEFSQQWTFDGLCGADGALYSADNITAMTGLKWLTRVPLSISAAATLVDEVVELADSGIKGYTLKESSSEYAGVEQRWFLIESEQRRKSDLKQLTKRIERHRQKSQQELISSVRLSLPVLPTQLLRHRNYLNRSPGINLQRLRLSRKNTMTNLGSRSQMLCPHGLAFESSK
jgi:transposase